MRSEPADLKALVASRLPRDWTAEVEPHKSGWWWVLYRRDEILADLRLVDGTEEDAWQALAAFLEREFECPDGGEACGWSLRSERHDLAGLGLAVIDVDPAPDGRIVVLGVAGAGDGETACVVPAHGRVPLGDLAGKDWRGPYAQHVRWLDADHVVVAGRPGGNALRVRVVRLDGEIQAEADPGAPITALVAYGSGFAVGYEGAVRVGRGGEEYTDSFALFDRDGSLRLSYPSFQSTEGWNGRTGVLRRPAVEETFGAYAISLTDAGWIVIADFDSFILLDPTSTDDRGIDLPPWARQPSAFSVRGGSLFLQLGGELWLLTPGRTGGSVCVGRLDTWNPGRGQPDGSFLFVDRDGYRVVTPKGPRDGASPAAFPTSALRLPPPPVTLDPSPTFGP